MEENRWTWKKSQTSEKDHKPSLARTRTWSQRWKESGTAKYCTTPTGFKPKSLMYCCRALNTCLQILGYRTLNIHNLSNCKRKCQKIFKVFSVIQICGICDAGRMLWRASCVVSRWIFWFNVQYNNKKTIKLFLLQILSQPRGSLSAEKLRYCNFFFDFTVLWNLFVSYPFVIEYWRFLFVLRNILTFLDEVEKAEEDARTEISQVVVEFFSALAKFNHSFWLLQHAISVEDLLKENKLNLKK